MMRIDNHRRGRVALQTLASETYWQKRLRMRHPQNLQLAPTLYTL
jgi:hypothetical protein